MNVEQDKEIMREVYIFAKKNSNDPRTNTGAGIYTNLYFIKGANKVPWGLEFSPEMGKSENKAYFLNHAERNAIAECSRMGVRTEWSTMLPPGNPVLLAV